MPRITCKKDDCLNNENGECMIFDLAINEEGFCVEYSPKESNDDIHPRHPDDR